MFFVEGFALTQQFFVSEVERAPHCSNEQVACKNHIVEYHAEAGHFVDNRPAVLCGVMCNFGCFLGDFC